MSDRTPENLDPTAGAAVPAEAPVAPANWPLDFVIDVPLRVTVEVGSTQMLVRDLLQLGKGAVVPLDRLNGDPADVLVNGKLVARGELSVVDDRVAVRVIEVLRKGIDPS